MGNISSAIISYNEYTKHICKKKENDLNRRRNNLSWESSDIDMSDLSKLKRMKYKKIKNTKQ